MGIVSYLDAPTGDVDVRAARAAIEELRVLAKLAQAKGDNKGAAMCQRYIGDISSSLARLTPAEPTAIDGLPDDPAMLRALQLEIQARLDALSPGEITVQALPAARPSPPAGRRTTRCGTCGTKGHNARSCAQKGIVKPPSDP